MRAGGGSGHSDIAYDLALAHPVPHLYVAIFRKMEIGRGIDRVVAYLDCVSAASGPALADDGSVTYGDDRGAGRGCVIDAGMRSYDSVDRMLPVVGEAGTDA